MTRRGFTILLGVALLCAACGDDESSADVGTDTGDTGDQVSARVTLSLNGTWEVTEGLLDDEIPSTFDHTISVPGLLSLAEPPFEDIGEPSELRQAFWHRTTFVTPTDIRDVSFLTIHKAKYTTRVWLNGELLGDHFGSYTLVSFDVSDLLLPSGEENELIVRLGAHRDSAPPDVPAGQDGEKDRWIPGIWDDVTLVSSSLGRIVRIKIEPNLDAESALVLTTLSNHADEDRTFLVTQRICAGPYDGESPFAEVSEDVLVAAGSDLVVEQTLALTDSLWWTPETPNLYTICTAVSQDGVVSDDLSTRFGMREVEWRGGSDYSGRFYLNGEPYYLRGTNITLHRFFEDELMTGQPWDEAWVRDLLTRYPQQLHWNTIRMTIGRAPNLWYDIADEVGLLLADEFQMWPALDGAASRGWTVAAMTDEVTSWVQENWNHPSIAWWDASNETLDERSTQLIEAVRGLDLTRQWENGGYNEPQGAQDPIEDHPYFYITGFLGQELPEPNHLQNQSPLPPQGGIPGTGFETWDAPDHPYINNEYAWLWITRTGRPTVVTSRVYNDVMGGTPEGGHDPDALREAYAYLTAGLTEFWRTGRGYAAVMHFVYLGYSRNNGETADNFIDLDPLVMEPRWLAYAENAFAPLGVYLHAWDESYPAGTRTFEVWLINDYPDNREVVLDLMVVDMSGDVAAQSAATTMTLEGLGRAVVQVDLDLPAVSQYQIFARLEPTDGEDDPTWCRRKVGFPNPGVEGPSPPFE